MRNLAIGISIGVLICMCILTYYPITDTETACQNCGHSNWWHKPSGEGEAK